MGGVCLIYIIFTSNYSPGRKFDIQELSTLQCVLVKLVRTYDEVTMEGYVISCLQCLYWQIL